MKNRKKAERAGWVVGGLTNLCGRRGHEVEFLTHPVKQGVLVRSCCSDKLSLRTDLNVRNMPEPFSKEYDDF